MTTPALAGNLPQMKGIPANAGVWGIAVWGGA